MKLRIITLALPSVIALTLLATGRDARAQGGDATPDPKVAEILGQPEASAAALDANIIAVLGQPGGGVPSDAQIGPRAADIAVKLRCPVCQGVSIADSPSSMATNMRSQVRELVSKGYNEEQILSYFERSYGEFVRLEPPAQGLNVMLWILPGVVLVGGGILIFMMARRPAGPAKAAAPAPSSTSGTPAAPVDPALEKYLEKIRRDSGSAS